MNKIKFSHNWNNKLNHEVFTTIRKSTPEKCQYYFDEVGKVFEVVNLDKHICNARLIEIEEKKFKEIPLGLLHTDTGIINNYEIEDLFKRFGITREVFVLILTFLRIKE